MASVTDKSKVRKLSLKGSSRLVAEFFQYSINTVFEMSTRQKTLLRTCDNFTHEFRINREPRAHFRTLVNGVKKYDLNMLVLADDQVKAYIEKIMSPLDIWMVLGKISKLVIVITDKDTGEHVERWQFDVQVSRLPQKLKSNSSLSRTPEQENTPQAAPAAEDKTVAEIQSENAAIFRQITASVTFLPQLSGDCTFNVLVYVDANSDVPAEWDDSEAKIIADGEHVQLRGFSTVNHRVDTLVSYRLVD